MSTTDVPDAISILKLVMYMEDFADGESRSDNNPAPLVKNSQLPPPLVEITFVVPGSSENDVSKWPATASYEYIAQNCEGEGLTTTAKKSIEKGAKSKNIENAKKSVLERAFSMNNG
ncbi:hypothetical protein GCK72_022752 [Caenorhabditis remanei]|uniref:Uncharacterized protein n=2 Tax=Caenorhabditis remanei TaxID=31234 RepID=A0A6A5FV05_CAERE|nr:hypothetical protein GCK72_022752 [Caenorhabditis remanei]KAF1746299.1 hypothetical protein GCK72_022752 [Caenorhabditis remanei]